MTQKQINEGIRLIAEFDGVKIVKGIIMRSPDMHRASEYYGRKYNEGLQYHFSWNWLMPVWEKIGNLESDKFQIEEVKIGRKGCYIKALTIPYNINKRLSADYVIGDDGCEQLFETTFRVIVEFIKWYNKNK